MTRVDPRDGARARAGGNPSPGEAPDARAVLDLLPAMISYWDADQRNVTANAAYLTWFGATAEDLRGRHLREVLGPDLYAKNLPYIRGVLAGREQLFDRTVSDVRGNDRHNQASYVPDIVEGRIRGFTVMVTDVTPSVEIRRALDDAQEIAHLGSWNLRQANGEITWSNELFRIFGLDPQKVTPSFEVLAGVIHPEDRERVLATVDQARHDGRDYQQSYRVLRPDGEIREVATRARVERDSQGRIRRLSGTVLDVTEANEAAREMARVNEELRQVNRVNADVISMLGHDVRTPLAVVLGFLEELDDGWQQLDEHERHGTVRRVRGSARRLGRLIDNILALATVDAGRIQPAPIYLALPRFVDELLADLPEGERVRRGPIDPEAVIRVDPFHLRQIATNLLTNAFRYGAEPVSLSVEGPGEDHVVTLIVADEGAGVPPEAHATLFERFADAGSQQLHTRGTGLGLYLAVNLTAANGGTLSYEHRTDEHGPRFVVRIPAAGSDD